MSTDSEANPITSVKWSQFDRSTLAIGLTDKTIELWNVDMKKCIGKIVDHTDRVATLDWNSSNVLTSGSRSGLIMNHDVRADPMKINELSEHWGEICGLKWCENKKYLASGSDDHKLIVWDNAFAHKPLHLLNKHKAAVKAIDWCSWKTHLLCSGGGKRDGTIKIWNNYDGLNVKTIVTDEQISGVLWCRNSRKLLASHENNFSAYKYPGMQQVSALEGHSERILNIARSRSDLVASIGADERLRIWGCFEISKRGLFSYNLTPISTKSLSKFSSIR